ncbi:MAG: toll/interleukin-1 receptor domain-containing protein [Thaumarchaeota archaeon]|nr:toll/interleukin-1 receptor domain-containing protein [Nitrososphaerota archaeon]
MTIELSFKLDKNDRLYVFFERGSVSISAKNLSNNAIQVFEVFLRFKERLPKFKTQCDVKIEPNQVVDLPNVEFKTDLRARDWSNFFNVGIKYRELQNGKKWSQSKWYVQEPHDYLLVDQTPKRNVKVFISHSNSTKDQATISKLDELLTKAGFTSYVAERNPKLGNNLWEKIHLEIIDCECFIVLFTKDGATSGDVREEMGIAVGLNKKDRIIPIVESDVTSPGSLTGMEHSKLDRNNINESLIKAVNYIVDNFEKRS